MASTTLICALAADDRLHHVVATGRALARTAQLQPLFVHVAEPIVPPQAAALGPGPAMPTDVEALREDAVAAGHRLLTDAGLGEHESLVVCGNAVVELDRLAVERDAALVLVGTHRRGVLSRALLGSVSRSLVERGSRPVLIARDPTLPCGDGPILAAVDPLAEDEDQDGPGPVDVAAALAGRMQRPLLLATVLGAKHLAAVAGPLAPPPLTVDSGERRAAMRLLGELAERTGRDDVELVALEGSPVAQRIDELATTRAADLLVVGGPPRSGLRRALEGSVSLELARMRGRPLVVVPRGTSA